MFIKHILVHLDHTLQTNARLAYAIEMARRQHAFLTGCYAINNLAFFRNQKQQAQLREAFLAQAGASDVPAQWMSIETQSSEQPAFDQFCRVAQCSDLVIVSQPTTRDDMAMPRDFPELLVVHSGRPILILPYAGKNDPNCKRVMVAWNGGRESVRSLHDALPLLQQAQQVNLLSLLINGNVIPDLENTVEMLCMHLAHHGIMANTETQICVDVSKGDVLLNRCAEEGIDLLVAGGYYHGHLGEVAMHLLKHMTVPVLMSH